MTGLSDTLWDFFKVEMSEMDHAEIRVILPENDTNIIGDIFLHVDGHRLREPMLTSSDVPKHTIHDQRTRGPHVGPCGPPMAW